MERSSCIFSMKKKILLIFIIILTAVIVSALCGYRYAAKSVALDPTDKEDRYIEVGMGMTAKDIGALLEKEEIIKSSTRFRLFSKIHKYENAYKAGGYYLSPSMSYADIAEALKSGKTSASHITIPEGYTVRDIAKKLASEDLVDPDLFIDLCRKGDFDYDFIGDVPDDTIKLEGFLFPDTYSFLKEETEEDIIRKMLERFNHVYNEKYRKRTEELGYSIKDIITMASIIEKETKLDEERKTVSGVIYNRLDIGMTLGMDSTLHYILNKRDPLTVDELNMDSPYNTYKFNGLPPGPIGSPGKKSIEAALYPEDTDYLYFVLSPKGDGSNAFSTNYEDFLADKKAYYDSIS